MKKNLSRSIVGISIAVALISIASSLSIAGRHKSEITKLQNQIGRMQAHIPDADATPLTIVQTIAADTNALAELEAEVVRLDAELAAAKENQPPQRESWADRMERMKENDPEAYAEMIQNRTERQEAMRYDLAERTANFMELDTAFMTDAEQENHELLIEKMAEVWELTDLFDDPENPPDRESMRELFGAINEARPLMDTERTTMFRQLANDLGYDGTEASEFSEYVEEIISATTLQSPRGGRRGP